MITPEQACEIAKKHLVETMVGQVSDIAEQDITATMKFHCRDCWIVQVSQRGPVAMIGAGRIICISKKTGNVVYDGPDGGE